MSRLMPQIEALTTRNRSEDESDFTHIQLLKVRPIKAYILDDDGDRLTYVSAYKRAYLSLITVADITKTLEILKPHIPPPSAPRYRIAPQLEQCIRLIDSEFTRPDRRRTSSLPATHFTDLLSGKFSYSTINKAKKLLGVASRHPKPNQRLHYEVGPTGRIAWRWMAPAHTVDEALKKGILPIADRPPRDLIAERYDDLNELLTIRMHSVTRALVEMMTSKGGVIPATMRDSLRYNRAYVMRAKRGLGIASLQEDGQHTWLWPGPPICQWVLDRVSEGADSNTIYTETKIPRKLIALAARALIDTRRMSASWRGP